MTWPKLKDPATRAEKRSIAPCARVVELPLIAKSLNESVLPLLHNGSTRISLDF